MEHERFVAKANITYFTELLSGMHGPLEADERRVIERLLAEEQGKLAWLERYPVGTVRQRKMAS